MSEIITTYLLKDPDQKMPMDRDDFYNEQIKKNKKKIKPDRAIEVVDIILFTPEKEIVIQKRSIEKRHNSKLLDKSIGGHVTFSNTPNFTVLTETLHELHTPSLLLADKEDFIKTYRLIKPHLNSQCLIQYVDTKTTNLIKTFKEGVIPIINRYHFYLGVYSGVIKPQTNEVSGIIYYDLDKLYKDIEKTPEIFTDDLKFFLNKYDKKIQEFLTQLD